MQQKGSLIGRAAVLAAVFVLAFLVRSLYAYDQAPVMYSPEQTGTRMAQRYDDTALAILAGEGILWPRVSDKRRTGLLSRPPGYALYLVAVYETLGRSFLAAQLVQNVLTSICCVLLVLLAARLCSWPIGVTAGVFAALSPQLGYVSALVLPDALSALPLARGAAAAGARASRRRLALVDERPRRRPRRRGRLAAPERGAAAAVPVARDPGRLAGQATRTRARGRAVAGRRPYRDPDHDKELRRVRRVRARLDQRRPHAVAGSRGRRRPASSARAGTTRSSPRRRPYATAARTTATGGPNPTASGGTTTATGARSRSRARTRAATRA